MKAISLFNLISKEISFGRALIRLDSPEITGIRHAIAQDYQMDYATLNDPPTLGMEYSRSLPAHFALIDLPKRTNGDVLQCLEEVARESGVPTVFSKTDWAEMVSFIRQELSLANGSESYQPTVA